MSNTSLEQVVGAIRSDNEHANNAFDMVVPLGWYQNNNAGRAQFIIDMQVPVELGVPARVNTALDFSRLPIPARQTLVAHTYRENYDKEVSKREWNGKTVRAQKIGVLAMAAGAAIYVGSLFMSAPVDNYKGLNFKDASRYSGLSALFTGMFAAGAGYLARKK